MKYNVVQSEFYCSQSFKIYKKNLNKVVENLNVNQRCLKRFYHLKSLRYKKAEVSDYEHSILSSVHRTKMRVYELARSNKWEWFFTFTFNPKIVDSTNYDECVKYLSKWLFNLKRKYAPNLKYIVVPELHADGKKYHFHGLFSNVGSMSFKFFMIDDKTRTPIYDICDYTLGWTTASIIKDSSRATSYISKYISKDLISVTSGRKRYWVSRNIKEAKISLYDIEIGKNMLVRDLIDDNKLNYVKTVDIPFTHNLVTYYDLKI